MSGTAFDPGTVSAGKALIVSLVLPSAATSIAAGADYDNPAFKHFTNLTTVSGANITTVGNYAFKDCAALTSVSLPQATSIGSLAFYGCTALASVSLPQATTIGGDLYAFAYCTALTSVDLPKATSIGSLAFAGCTALASVFLPQAQTIGDYAFSTCPALNNVSLPASLGTIGVNPFAGCTSLTNLTVAAGSVFSVVSGALIKDGNTLIGYPAAAGAVTLSSITAVNNSAFDGCTALTSVDLSAAQTIGESAFDGCTALTSVDLPQATSIGSLAFDGCTALTSVDLSAATSIGMYAFGFTGTTTLTVTLGATPPTVGSNMFNGISSAKTVTVKVPSGATGYGTLPLTVSGDSDTSDCWANAFRGKGWTSPSGPYGNGAINTNINLTITAQP